MRAVETRHGQALCVAGGAPNRTHASRVAVVHRQRGDPAVYRRLLGGSGTGGGEGVVCSRMIAWCILLYVHSTRRATSHLPRQRKHTWDERGCRLERTATWLGGARSRREERSTTKRERPLKPTPLRSYGRCARCASHLVDEWTG